MEEAKISVVADGAKLICEALCDTEKNEKHEYAFYIFLNSERIHTEWYSERRIFEFDTASVAGCYHVKVFVRNTSGQNKQATSSSIFMNPKEVEIQDFNSSSKDSIAYSLKTKNWTFPALYYPAGKKFLFVLLPSAINRKKSSLPAFHRWKWAVEGVFPGNVLCISDPTLELHNDLDIGWLLGNSESDASAELADFVVEIAASSEIPTQNIIFYGSSAGGFSALSLAALVDGSTAVAINAQVDVSIYKVVEQVELVSQTCFGTTKEVMRDSFASRIDMKVKWNSASGSRLILVQNIDDWHHHNIHFKPFWKSLGGNPDIDGVERIGNNIAWTYHQEGGHVPETKEMAFEIIKYLGIN